MWTLRHVVRSRVLRYVKLFHVFLCAFATRAATTPSIDRPTWLPAASVNGTEDTEDLTYLTRMSNTTPLGERKASRSRAPTRQPSYHSSIPSTTLPLHRPSIASPNIWREDSTPAPLQQQPQLSVYQQQTELINSLKNLSVRQQERIYSSGSLYFDRSNWFEIVTVWLNVPL